MYVCEGKGSSIRLVAGLFFWVTILLTAFVSPLWVWLGALPATMLLVSYFTGFCPAEIMLRRLGVEERLRVRKSPR